MTNPSEVRVLVVEDDPVFQRILHKRISSEGFQVFLAADGREGLREIVAREPHLVVSDWMMPEVDGLELCQSVKTGLGETAPYFILLTAKGEISDRLLGLQTGADDYLVKPCDHGELMARIRAGIRIVTLTQQLRRKLAELQTAIAERKESPAEGARAGGGPAQDGAWLCRGCRRVRLPDGTWQPLQDYLAAAPAGTGDGGICSDCARRQEADRREAA